MKKVIFTLITIATFFLSPLTSEASHFRYGHITWTRVPGTRTVTFTVTTAWRYDFTESVNLDFGDGTPIVTVTGTEIQYVPNNYRVFQGQVTHTYATDGPFTASFNNCCRISTLQNGADNFFTVSSLVCLSNNNLGSPVCSSPVIIEMSAGNLNQYQLIMSEPDGSPITYSTTALASSNYVPSVGGNTASVSSTGLISWNTTGALDGQLYQMKVSMSDGCAATEIDFIIKITACSSTPASAILSGTQSINLGQSANLNATFNGTPPWTYRLSGTTTDITTSTTPTTISVTPTVLGANTYTLTSVSNTCGNGSVSGNAVVTTNVPPLLLACYPFNGNAQDSKGTNHGTVNGATLTTDRFGNANSAYNFDGNGNYIAIPGGTLAVSQYTYSAWISASELPAYGESRTILSVGNAGGDQFLMLLNSSATNGPAWNYGSYMGYVTPVLPPLLSYTSVVANNWVHFVVVRSSTDRKIYINGQLSVSNTASGSPYYSTPILGAIGARFNNTQIQTFKGAIDDVKIYSGTLNDVQVQALYLAEQQCPTIETGGLLAVTSLSSTIACVGGNVTANIITNNINTSTSAISVQLSDASGSFTNPVQIGTGTSNTIVCTIPSNLTGGKYKVRAVFGISPNQVVSVNSLPLTLNPKITIIPNITTANTTICNSNSIILSATGCLLNTYVWTGGLTGSSITVSPSSTKSYKVACVATPCVGDSSSVVTITVNPKPLLPTITSPNTTICSGISTTLTASGCAGTYTWTGGLTGSSVSVSPTTTKSYKVVCTVNNCNSDSTNAVIITVNPKPSPPNTSANNSSICSGGSAILTATGCVGGSYTWTGGLISASITVSPTVTRSYNAVCRINNCVSDSSLALIITVNPKPASPTISVSNTTVCSGVSTTLTATGCAGGTYAWTGGLTGSSITVAPITTKAYKSVCIVNNCSSDSSAASTITVSPTSPTPVTTATSVCQGNSIVVGNGLKSTTPNCSGVGGSTTVSYSGGTVGYDGGGSSGSNPTAVATGLTGTITKIVVSATWLKKAGGDYTSCGVPHIGGNPSLSEMSFILQAPDNTLITLVPANTYQGNYVGGVITTFDDASATVLSSTPFTGSVKPSSVLSALNGKSANGTWTLIPNDNGGGDPLCVSGFSVTITTSGSPSTSTITWWNAATGGTQVGTGAEYLPATSTLAPGTYTYYAEVACTGACPSIRVATVLTVNPKLAAPTVIPTNANICSGLSATLLASGCTAGSTYTWTGGLTGSSVTVTPTATKNYKVACLINGCVGDSSSAVTVTVATSMYSIVSGNWDLASTWSCGRIPLSSDNVTVSTGHTVTIRDANARAKNLFDNGQLLYVNAGSKLTLGTIIIPPAPTTVTLILQPGPTDGKDSEISSYNSNTPYPDVIYTNLFDWTIGGSENIKRCFFGYDLSTIPTNAVVDSAFFSLYFSQAFINGPQGAFYSGHTVYGGDNAFFINRITGNWTESGITWNNKPTFSTANQVSIAPFTDYRQDYPKMNVKNLVADMVVNPTNSFGFMLRHQVEAIYKITIFATSDDPNPAVRPKLQVYYHLP